MNKLILIATVLFQINSFANELQVWQLDELTPSASNAQNHSPEDFVELVDYVKNFDQFPDHVVLPKQSLFTQPNGAGPIKLSLAQCNPNRMEVPYKDFKFVEFRSHCYLRNFQTPEGTTIDYLIRIKVRPKKVGGGYFILAAGTLQITRFGELHSQIKRLFRIEDIQLTGIGAEAFEDQTGRNTGKLFGLVSDQDEINIVEDNIANYFERMLGMQEFPNLLNDTAIEKTVTPIKQH